MRKNAQLTMNCAQRDHLLGVAVLFLLFAAALSPWALAKEADPDSSTSVANASGYNRNSIYTTIDGPEIDAFNFNFVVEFPVAVGLSYPENAGLNLQLNLTYNSRVWHWQKQVCNRKFFRVRRQNPFGLGFDLTLGRIIRSLTANPDSGWQYMYVDSSGATHRLALFSGDEYRSHDGSHIRAVLASDAWTVGFPNGVVHELDHHITGPTISDMANQGDPCDPQDFDDPPTHVFMPDGPPPVVGWDRVYVGWHVTKVYTRASLDGAAIPSYTVSYYGDDGNVDDAPFAHIIKEINDRFGRRIWTDLDRTDGTVTAIHAPAPADECGSPRTADYLLNYGTTSLAISGLPGPDPGQTHTETHVATVLQSISGPNVAPPTGATVDSQNLGTPS